MPSEKFLIYLLYFSRTGIYEELYSSLCGGWWVSLLDLMWTKERTIMRWMKEIPLDTAFHQANGGGFFRHKVDSYCFYAGVVVMPRDLFWAYPNGHPVNYYYLYHPEVKCPLVNLFSLNTAKRKERKRANQLRQKK